MEVKAERERDAAAASPGAAAGADDATGVHDGGGAERGGSREAARRRAGDRDPRDRDARDRDRAEHPGFTVTDRRWWARADDDGEPAGDRPPTYVAKLEAELAQRDAQLAEIRRQHRAAVEELERAKQRLEREAARKVELEVDAVLRDLLEVGDDLDRAREAAEAAGVDGVREGIELVRKRFLAALAKHGVEPIDAAGQPFDPARHDAVATVDVDDPALDGAVARVMRAGYARGDRVLRPAMVAVGRRAAGGNAGAA